ncbi:protein of unknown function [Azospirillum baldaniorum]|uniref:Uncharacterized protein n=1 Tax=Azospirillum baldaniorum TaxID=1064539 RepID=A0A9P1JQ34_9PROT|nr:protein of unknown function [Azospirillum baldaniorum]
MLQVTTAQNRNCFRGHNDSRACKGPDHRFKAVGCGAATRCAQKGGRLSHTRHALVARGAQPAAPGRSPRC